MRVLLTTTAASALRGPSAAERPWLAPATLAIVWNGRQWIWAQWTGVEWTAAPWIVHRAVTSTALAPPASASRPLQEAWAARTTPKRRRRRGDGPGTAWLVLGHIVASLLGLLLGYAIVCQLHPGEFSWLGF